MKNLIRFLGPGLGLALTGCATMFGESYDEIQLSTEPEGAQVYLHNNLLGVTPMKTSMPRVSDPVYLVFRKEGYSAKTVQLNRTVAGSAFLNLFFLSTTFGATSWGVDYGTGKMFRYTPLSYVVDLQKKTAGLPTPLEYTIVNYDRLKIEATQGHGEFLQGLCGIYEFNPARCSEFLGRLAEKKTELVRLPHALAWYRAVNHLAL